MSTVGQILENKGSDVWSLEPTSSIADAVTLMAKHDVGALVVRDGAGAVVGLVSERDCARRVVIDGLAPASTPVTEIMTSRVVCAALAQSADQCLRTMTERRFRHLPVVEDEKLVGMVSIGDLVKAIMNEQQFTIEQLEHYIAGS